MRDRGLETVTVTVTWSRTSLDTPNSVALAALEKLCFQEPWGGLCHVELQGSWFGTAS